MVCFDGKGAEAVASCNGKPRRGLGSQTRGWVPSLFFFAQDGLDEAGNQREAIMSWLKHHVRHRENSQIFKGILVTFRYPEAPVFCLARLSFCTMLSKLWLGWVGEPFELLCGMTSRTCSQVMTSTKDREALSQSRPAVHTVLQRITVTGLHRHVTTRLCWSDSLAEILPFAIS